jgi:hypothetical protein
METLQETYDALALRLREVTQENEWLRRQLSIPIQNRETYAALALRLREVTQENECLRRQLSIPIQNRSMSPTSPGGSDFYSPPNPTELD